MNSPKPTNRTLMARREAAVPRGVAHATSQFADRAQNAEVWDVEGRHYVDFAAGIAVLNTGHRHPAVVAAVEEQLRRFTHTAFQVMPYESYIALAERLNGLVPISGPLKSVFFSTGAEALENAVKIARAASGRSAVISFTGGFHGRTLFTSALTGKVMPYKHRFGPTMPEVFHVPFPVEHHGISVEDSLRALDYLFRASVEASQVAAIIIEPVQGEGGFYIAPTELLVGLRRLCDLHGIALVVDEVQTGFGRTGAMFAIEHAGIEPDLMTVAKSIAAGFPLSGVVGRAALMDAAEPGGLGGTYGGNPVACAAALAVLDVIESEGLLARATQIGRRMTAFISALVGRSDMPPISTLRSLGAMVAFELTNAAGDPDAALTKRVTRAALDEGLVLLSCGVFANVIRLLVPLTVSDEVLATGLQRLEAALAAARAENPVRRPR
jgi:4-aminobutyrate aminotransferase / (S)-3-amino-2-methylpropionate transaminase / 5-aminovalerate transaminase